jgi:hypothetical protein
MIKKLAIASMLLACGLMGSAQNLTGIFGGVQSTTAQYKIRDKSQTTSSKIGAQLGATLKIPFDQNLYFAPTANYSLKGFKVQLMENANPPGENIVSNDVTIHTLELAPLFHIDLSKNPSHFFLRVGPAIDLAFKGSESLVMKDGVQVNRDMKFSFADYGRITSSGVVHLGYESKGGLFVFGHYSHGLGSLNNNDGGPTIRHRLFGLSIGKYFGRNPNVMDTRALDE